MSEDALNQAIADRWADAGLDASSEDLDIPAEPEVAEGTENTEVDASVEPVGDKPAEEAPVADDEPVAEATPEPVAEPEAPKTTEAQQDAEDELAIALGLGKPPDDPKKRAQWWKTRLPYSQIHKVYGEQQKKWQETHETALKPLNEKITGFESRFKDVETVEKVIAENPEQYIRTLATLFPETYGQYFAPLFQGYEQPQGLPEPQDVPMPEPNYKLPDGSMTYDLEGIKQLMEWQKSQTTSALSQQFKPYIDSIQQQEKAAKDRAAADARYSQARQTTNTALEVVKKWEKGSEHLNDILAEAAKLDPSYDVMTALSMAYHSVVMPKIKADRDAMRAEILAEGKKAAAKKTALAVAPSSRVATKEPVSSDENVNDRIKAAWKRKGLI